MTRPTPNHPRRSRLAIAQRLRPSFRSHAEALVPGILRLAVLALCIVLPACSPKRGNDLAPRAGNEAGALFRVGSIVVYQTDLNRELEEKHIGAGDAVGGKKALAELITRAQFAQAALEANLDRDPVVRAQMARVLASRLKEQTLLPRLKAMAAPIPEPRLRELYETGVSRFRSNEKRQVAVLWLNPGGDPGRGKQYEEKLATAREWFFTNSDLKDHPDQGFSVLSVDYSEHAASRYKGGMVGWLESEGGMDAWTKAVAQIAFALKEPGEVSAVTTRPEGIFLVRLMALKTAVLRPFESVAGELDQAERQRMRAAAEAEFERTIKAKHPVQRLTP